MVIPKPILLGVLATLVMAAFLASCLAVYFFMGNVLDPLDSGRSSVADEYLGQTKVEFIRRHGRPSRQWAGHYGCPRLDYAKQHPSAVTLTYRRWTGTLYLSFEQVGGEWRCFSSHWMPDGSVF
jgi:hypothetical protein